MIRGNIVSLNVQVYCYPSAGRFENTKIVKKEMQRRTRTRVHLQQHFPRLLTSKRVMCTTQTTRLRESVRFPDDKSYGLRGLHRNVLLIEEQTIRHALVPYVAHALI